MVDGWGFEIREEDDLQLKNDMYILCMRGIVSRERSIFIYLVCTLFCLFKTSGLAGFKAEHPVTIDEFDFFDSRRKVLLEVE